MSNTIARKQNGNQAASFGNVVDNIFQNSLRRFFDDNYYWEPSGNVSTASVPVNVRETDLQYEMDVVAPGCRKENFNIQVKDNVLTVSMNHQEENREKDEKQGWVRNEYSLRSFSKSFTLDETVDINKIDASYADGILKVVLPKNEKAKKISRSISIK